MPSGDADVMLACKYASTFGTTSDIEMEHGSAELRCRLAQREYEVRSCAWDLYFFMMPAKQVCEYNLRITILIKRIL